MAKLPGVGYAAANAPCPSVWEFQSGRTAVSTAINFAHRPFGKDGGGPADRGSIGAPMDVLSVRYHGGQMFSTSLSPQGLWGDMYQINAVCLQRWFADQPQVWRDQYDGIVTLEDLYDVASANGRRNTPFYAEYWFARLIGGTPGTAIVIDSRSWYRHVWLVEDEGWGLGLHAHPNNLGYATYYDVRWLPEDAVPVDPPPTPVPPPPPPPTPVPPPTRYLSTPEVRALELWEKLVEDVFRRARPIPQWLIRLKQSAKDPVVELLPDVVRIKRRLAGRPEEGTKP